MTSRKNKYHDVAVSNDTIDDVFKHLTRRQLYGGALELLLPSVWRDVSIIRQVPSHQEVYQDYINESLNNTPSWEGGTGAVFTIEIFQYERSVEDENAARFYFDDLSKVNSNADCCLANNFLKFDKVYNVGDKKKKEQMTMLKCEAVRDDEDENISMPKLKQSVKACCCSGVQRVTKAESRHAINPLHGDKSKDLQDATSWVCVELCVVRFPATDVDLLLTLTTPVDSLDDGQTAAVHMKNINVIGRQQGNEACGYSVLFKAILDSFSVKDWALIGLEE